MQIPKDKKILVLRYGTNIVNDCMQLHQDVITEQGYCWFGKLGRSPSAKVLEQLLEDGFGYVILYARAGTYIARFTEVIYDKPDRAYPQYYDQLLYSEGYIPSVYFKIFDLEPMKSSQLQELVVSSSKNSLIDTLNKSMNSFFCVEYRHNRGEISKIKVVTQKTESRPVVIDGCIYRINGKCNKKGFVNYQYECERPKQCVGQKL